MTKHIFFDTVSEKLYKELSEKTHHYSNNISSRVMLEFGNFNIAESYVTSKLENRYGDIVNINIEGGRNGIELQGTLFDLKGKKLDVAYLITEVKVGQADRASSSSSSRRYEYNDNVTAPTKVLVRRLPILGIKDWLLIYEDTLFLLAVKDAYNEMEIIAFSG
ncbi:MAG TPA: hypothetical protein VIP70_05780 [Nitrososphaeraceae archaeon]